MTFHRTAAMITCLLAVEIEAFKKFAPDDVSCETLDNNVALHDW